MKAFLNIPQLIAHTIATTKTLFHHMEVKNWHNSYIYYSLVLVFLSELLYCV